MHIIKVNSEWDLGIPDLYMYEETARAKVAEALPQVYLEGTLEEYEDEGLINFEVVVVVED